MDSRAVRVGRVGEFYCNKNPHIFFDVLRSSVLYSFGVIFGVCLVPLAHRHLCMAGSVGPPRTHRSNNFICCGLLPFGLRPNLMRTPFES